MSNEEDTRSLVLSIIDFLRSQLTERVDLSIDDRDSLRIAIECLEIAFNLENRGYVQRRPLLDMYSQVANPVSIQNKLRAETLKNEGNAKMAQEQYQEAETAYTTAIELDKWNAIYYCNRAAARLKLGQFYEAISDCRQALVLNPDYAKAYGRMGQAYVQMNRPRSAVSCFQHAVRLEPDNTKYRNNLEVAQREAAQASSQGMENFIQNILSLIARNGSEGQGQGGPPPGLRPFMILTEPHRERDCASRRCPSDSTTASDGSNPSSPNEQAERDGEGNSDTRSAEGIDSNETVHFRMIFGIPRYTFSPEDSANESPDSSETQQKSPESATRITEIPQVEENQPKSEEPSSTSDSQPIQYRPFASRSIIKDKPPSVHARPMDQKKTTGNVAEKDELKDSDPFREIVRTMTENITRTAQMSTSRRAQGLEKSPPQSPTEKSQEQKSAIDRNADKTATEDAKGVPTPPSTPTDNKDAKTSDNESKDSGQNKENASTAQKSPGNKKEDSNHAELLSTDHNYEDSDHEEMLSPDDEHSGEAIGGPGKPKSEADSQGTIQKRISSFFKSGKSKDDKSKKPKNDENISSNKDEDVSSKKDGDKE